MQLSPDQTYALEVLESGENVFLTGKAGTGKSTVLRSFLAKENPEETAILASTGAAAVLVGGRTFHSFFGLGILEGGPSRTIERALKQPRLRKRLKDIETVVIDEISMISGETLAVAESIAQQVRGNFQPWGGIRMIAVGDFAQLPPVTRDRPTPDWAFQHEVWDRTAFRSVALSTVHRCPSADWNDVLNRVREGNCDQVVKEALDARVRPAEDDEDMTRLFGMRQEAENYNRFRLSALPSIETVYATEYRGDAAAQDQLRRNCPVADQLILKMDALVMIRRNDADGLYVNGSLGHVRAMREKFVTVELLENGIKVEIEPVKFEMLNADGEVVATAKNFPLNLAYGTTIHKSQGATLDAVRIRLARLWESGQAYVALSRVRHPDRLFLDGWDPRSIRADESVRTFHDSLSGSAPAILPQN
ncbi:MAG: RRM3/PIF1 helicase-like protein [Proteobacteria bacterium]|nr:MAG: RRM3/PIF1 helicase-like protein [Pseudomonadota bacterium]